jgi:nucleotidyltransferase/DNA polymerase involved in DNA repair
MHTLGEQIAHVDCDRKTDHSFEVHCNQHRGVAVAVQRDRTGLVAVQPAAQLRRFCRG